MLEMHNDTLTFSFAQVHPSARLSIDLQRTLRIPDNGKTYPLPAGLGRFPLRLIDNFRDKLPASWLEKGGVMLPMYQSEAMWIKFQGHSDKDRGVSYPFAVKISLGKISALTAESWESGLRPKDYCVAPNQRWIDGYVVANERIKQFVAAPMGSGVSVEYQVTGKDEFGGIQIEVFPMKAERFNQLFPVQPRHDYDFLRSRRQTKGGIGDWSGTIGGTKGITSNSLGHSLNTNFGAALDSTFEDYRPQNIGEIHESDSDDVIACAGVQSMSMGAGGEMAQQIIADPYGIDAWDQSNSNRCFIHLVNSMTWRAVTGQQPPTVPLTSKEYSRHGLPWFDYYVEHPSLTATDKLKGIKSVGEMKPEMLPENQSIKVSSDKVHVLSEKPTPNAVREGSW
jgi:hypothetical protein